MAEIDYSKLSRQQKLAIFLIVIGPDAAGEVLRQFGDREAEQLCREMSQFTMVAESVQRQAIEEFTGLVAQSAGSAIGGLPYAQRALGLAKGDAKASTIMGRLSPAGQPLQVIKDLSEMEGRQIFNLLKAEQAQTIAYVLSHLDGGKAAEIFSLFSPELREDVLERLGTLESTSVALVDKVSQSLGRHLDAKVRPHFHFSGGVRAVAGLLNQLEKNMTRTLLSRLDERNNALSLAVRKQMFSFEDIGRLSQPDMQRLLREIDSVQLATALKGATEAMRSKVAAALSKRAAEGLREEIELLGALKPKDIDAAQTAIIGVVRRLEEEGQVSLDGEAAQPAVA
jgi:flagellar motor switch protein FliG